QNIGIGQDYDKIKKAYSINIVYFELGQGKDYVYRGSTEFRGLHDRSDILGLSKTQKKLFRRETVGDLLPEYYILRVEDFDRKAATPLDEWISFLKTGEIPETAQAPGLAAARSKLIEDGMSANERLAYHQHMENLRYQRSVIKTGLIEGREEGLIEGMEKGMEKGRLEGLTEGMEKGRLEGLTEGIEKGIEKGIGQIILTSNRNGFTVEQITAFSGLSREKVLEIIKANEKKS
ncbi:MAG: hypothetical protein LBC98_10410, partial [Prevotellaceae bacterium]|nr:hypothetical protein [Prevotellaceae bacterium]